MPFTSITDSLGAIRLGFSMLFSFKTSSVCNLITRPAAIKLDQDFPDAEDNLVEGQTYKMTLCFTASNGKVTYLDKDAVEKSQPVEIEFVYVPTTDTGTDNPDAEAPDHGGDE